MTVIRPYEPRDLAGLMSAWENATKLAHPFLSEDFLATERKNIPALYIPNARTWVAEADGAVIGFIAMIGAEVGAIFVQPERHGEGTGRALMDQARASFGALEVEVFEANSVGRRFYARYGFTEIGRRKHPETGFELMRLACPAP